MAVPGVMLATLVDEPFDDPEWAFETKWDGVRAICHVDRQGRVSLRSRTGQDLLRTFPEFEALARALAGLSVTIDGEIVALDDRGRSSFQRLQPRVNRQHPTSAEIKAIPATYVVFDLLEYRGQDITEKPLEQRQALLRQAITERTPLLELSQGTRGKGRAAFEAAKRVGLEGIVAKRLTSPYQRRRSRDWLKIKVQQRQEFAIGGWTEPSGSRQRFGSLLLGLYDDHGLRYAGGVGTGFDEATLQDLGRRLDAIETPLSPFTKAPSTASPAHWVQPRLVVEVKFSEWTRSGSLRQPVYVGLRSDKRPRDCVRERPAS